MHPRKAIRNATRAQLLNQTAAGANVQTTRVLPWQPGAALPGGFVAVAIYTLDEDVDPESADTAPRLLKRHPTLAIDVIRRAGDDNVDDLLDDDAATIERLMSADATLGGTAEDSWLRRTEFLFDDQGDQIVARMRMHFEVIYRGYAPDGDDQTFDALKTVGVTYDLANAQEPANQTHDQIDNLDEG